MLETRTLRFVDTLCLALLLIAARCLRCEALRRWTDRLWVETEPRTRDRLTAIACWFARNVHERAAPGFWARAYVPAGTPQPDASPQSRATE
jgi:hypothetical protein